MSEVTERHVQAVWYDSALRPRRLFTRRGSEVVVVSPGEWNLEAGPDFRNAVLELGRDRRRVVGDVEVHLAPSDWNAHRHGSDPAYRNVIAHVTWGCGPVPSSLPPGAVSIWLGRFALADPAFSPDQIDLDAYPYARLPLGERPCELKLASSPDRMREVLAAAGRHRLRAKAKRISTRLRAVVGEAGRRQVFYEEVMTALGYRKNKVQFRRVAERVPLDVLTSEPDVAAAALLAAGGFEIWNRRGIRPQNRVERRLRDAARVFIETPTLEFADAVDFSGGACREMVDGMCGDHCMGKGRASAVLANVIAPFAFAEGRLGEFPDWLPPEDVSSPVRLTAFRLFGRDHNPSSCYAKNGLLIQGLLQIHADCCERHYPDCEGCLLPQDSQTPASAFSP